MGITLLDLWMLRASTTYLHADQTGCTHREWKVVEQGRELYNYCITDSNEPHWDMYVHIVVGCGNGTLL